MKKAIKTNTKVHSKNLIEHEKRIETRLNKYISDSGFCSRREADRYIEAGKVKINNVVAVIGDKVKTNDIVKVNDKIISNKIEKIYIVLNKPKNITSTTDLNIKNNIKAFVNHEMDLFTIGRLDKDSTGLILLTNDGDIVNKLLRNENGHKKEYIVKLNRAFDNDFINKMERGVLIFNPVKKVKVMTNKCEVKRMSDVTFKITLKQGLNRQIRRMVETLGYEVLELKRITFAGIELGNLREGSWRYLTDNELKDLNKMIN